MSIGKNIKRLREQAGLTQAELGKIAGVTDKAVSTWENGSAEPRMGAVQRMADYFGVRKCEIYEDAPSSSVPALSEDEERILHIYRALNDFGKRKAWEHLEDLAQIERYTTVAEDSRQTG